MTFHPYDYTLVNALTFALGLLILMNSYRLARSGDEDLSSFLLSVILGIGLVVVAIVPNLFELFAAVLGLELRARAILVVSNLTLFCVTYYLVMQVVELRGMVSTLNEELSLLKRRVEDDD